MIPTSPPPLLINKGIVIYCPSSVTESRNSIVRLDIYYNPNNPYMSFLGCDSNSALIWSQSTTQTSAGTIFTYQTLEDLVAGYYTLKVSAITSLQTSEGTRTIGLIKPTPYLVIGLPYSIYEPISLS